MIDHTRAPKTDDLSLPPLDYLAILDRLLPRNLLHLRVILVRLVESHSVGLIQKRNLLFAVLGSVAAVLIAVLALACCVIVVAFVVAFALVVLLRYILVYDVGGVGTDEAWSGLV